MSLLTTPWTTPELDLFHFPDWSRDGLEWNYCPGGWSLDYGRQNIAQIVFVEQHHDDSNVYHCIWEARVWKGGKVISRRLFDDNVLGKGGAVEYIREIIDTHTEGRIL